MSERPRRPEQPTISLEARLPASVRNPKGLARCQRVIRREDEAPRQCMLAAREGFRACGSHGAGYPKREREGIRRNPAKARITNGRFAKIETLRTLAQDDEQMWVLLQFREMRGDLDRMLRGVEQRLEARRASA